MVQTFLSRYFKYPSPKKSVKSLGIRRKFINYYPGVRKPIKLGLNMVKHKNVLRGFVRHMRKRLFQKKLNTYRALARRGMRDMIPAVKKYYGWK